MNKEERREKHITEALVAREVLRRRAESFLETMAEPDPSMTIMSIEIEGLQRWAGIALADDVAEAFWGEVLRGIEYWLGRVKEATSEHNIPEAVRLTRLMLKGFASYAEPLGVEIPPEEEMPEAPSVAEEVEAEAEPGPEDHRPLAEVEERSEEPQGTSLTVLFPELSTRAYNALCRSGVLARAVGIAEDDRRNPYVEEIVSVLKDESRGEKFFLWDVRLFGPKALEELKNALRKHGFLPAEEEPAGKPWCPPDEQYW